MIHLGFLIIQQSKKVVCVSLVLLSISLTVVFTYLSIQESYAKQIQAQREQVYGSWHEASFDTASDSEKDGNIYIMGSVEINDEATVLLGSFDSTMFDLANLQLLVGRLPENNHEVVVEESYFRATQTEYNIDETLLVTYQNRENESIQKEYTVVGIIKNYSSNWVSLSYDYPTIISTNETSIDRITFIRYNTLPSAKTSPNSTLNSYAFENIGKSGKHDTSISSPIFILGIILDGLILILVFVLNHQALKVQFQKLRLLGCTTFDLCAVSSWIGIAVAIFSIVFGLVFTLILTKLASLFLGYSTSLSIPNLVLLFTHILGVWLGFVLYAALSFNKTVSIKKTAPKWFYFGFTGTYITLAILGSFVIVFLMYEVNKSAYFYQLNKDTLQYGSSYMISTSDDTAFTQPEINELLDIAGVKQVIASSEVDTAVEVFGQTYDFKITIMSEEFLKNLEDSYGLVIPQDVLEGKSALIITPTLTTPDFIQTVDEDNRWLSELKTGDSIKINGMDTKVTAIPLDYFNGAHTYRASNLTYSDLYVTEGFIPNSGFTQIDVYTDMDATFEVTDTHVSKYQRTDAMGQFYNFRIQYYDDYSEYLNKLVFNGLLLLMASISFIVCMLTLVSAKYNLDKWHIGMLQVFGVKSIQITRKYYLSLMGITAIFFMVGAMIAKGVNYQLYVTNNINDLWISLTYLPSLSSYMFINDLLVDNVASILIGTVVFLMFCLYPWLTLRSLNAIKKIDPIENILRGD